jgi:hypothetical protein
VIAHLDVGSQRGNQAEARAEGMPMAELRWLSIMVSHKFADLLTQ